MVFLYFVVGVAKVPEALILVVAVGIEVFVVARVPYVVDLVEVVAVPQVVVALKYLMNIMFIKITASF